MFSPAVCVACSKDVSWSIFVGKFCQPGLSHRECSLAERGCAHACRKTTKKSLSWKILQNFSGWACRDPNSLKLQPKSWRLLLGFFFKSLVSFFCLGKFNFFVPQLRSVQIKSSAGMDSVTPGPWEMNLAQSWYNVSYWYSVSLWLEGAWMLFYCFFPGDRF